MAGEGATARDGLIGGAYGVDPTRALGDVAGGLPAFAVRDERGDRPDLMAVQVRADAPARMQLMASFAQGAHPGICAPVALGRATQADGRYGLFAIGQAPGGAALQLGKPWGEAALVARVAKPAAAALEAMRLRGATHRNIRLGNVFATPDGEGVTLGQFWAAPGASLQPALFEPPYVAMCQPAARGEGRIADDVYALGVLMLALALGRLPLVGLDDEAVVRRKLELGSYDAIAGDERLPPGVADLIRCMLAEDPDHRPSPELLSDPAAARSRRVAMRPAQRAQRSIAVGERLAFDPRSLAYALACEVEHAPRLLRAGAVERWVRRDIGDASLAGCIEEFVKFAADTGGDQTRADSLLVMRAISALDPLTPMVWRGLAFWPDAIGPMLAAMPAEGDADTRLDEVVHGEVTVTWSQTRLDAADLALLKQEARQHRAWARLAGWSGGRTRLRYALNSALACSSPLLDGHQVTRLAELIVALDAVTGAGDSDANPIDREIAGFVAARYDQRNDSEIALIHKVGGKGGGEDGERAALALMRLLAGLQSRYAPDRKLQRLSARMARITASQLQHWRSLARRTHMSERLSKAAASGDLPGMLAVLDDHAAQQTDAAEALAAERAVREIDAALARIAAEAPVRAETALRLGTELAALVGAAALLAVVIAAAVA